MSLLVMAAATACPVQVIATPVEKIAKNRPDYMELFQLITKAIKSGQFNITRHVRKEIQEDLLTIVDVSSSVLSGKVIEDYPTDFPFPSCLIFGRNLEETPIHSVWAFDKKTQITVLITAYRPDPNRWINFEIRR